jgi:hypothetical protein
MALEFKQRTIEFDLTPGKQREPFAANFSRDVRTAEGVIKGFNVRYGGSGEHPLHELEIDIDDITINGTQVSGFVDFGLRDGSGSFDDAFKGWVQVIVIADTEN